MALYKDIPGHEDFYQVSNDGKLFGVGQDQISRIISGKRWKHIL